MRFKTQVTATAIALLLSAMQAGAQTADPLKAAVEKAVLTNPEVSARFHAYRAAIDAIDVARAAYRPRLDLSASVGHDSDRITSRSPEPSQSLYRNGVALSLTQLLWDGLGTTHTNPPYRRDRAWWLWFVVIPAPDPVVVPWP